MPQMHQMRPKIMWRVMSTAMIRIATGGFSVRISFCPFCAAYRLLQKLSTDPTIANAPETIRKMGIFG
ncbi:hypothetical protein PMAYCL1PPCAC_04304 [Pristionchus mayeri]|uniref:Uncharacterized protein n=1 Tax=Pristionchus mayeri TaxID=1317129 RepID=A0AAN4Z6N6_9BILA|nr:hypothetical protein PMAYCL1PPCAC_04304 [Pristionchus mayeri]